VLACLLRPELVPFLGVYKLWLWRAEPRLRLLVASCFVGSAAAVAALFALMTQAGFSGNPRYVLPALALTCVLAGVGSARMLAAAGGLTRRPTPALGAAAAALARCAGAVPFATERAQRMQRELHQVGARMDLHRDLAEAIDRLGAPRALSARSGRPPPIAPTTATSRGSCVSRSAPSRP
jgi:hypothetical protein